MSSGGVPASDVAQIAGYARLTSQPAVVQRRALPTVYAHHTEEDMNLALAQPWCSIG